MSLKALLEEIQDKLQRKDVVRDEIQRCMRKVIRFSKQAILFVHQEQFNEAEKSLDSAKELFTNLYRLSEDHKDLVYLGIVDAAFQEYAEAQTLFEMVKHGCFVNPTHRNIPDISYVLGLADVIGELRRRTLDLLRRGDVELAEDCLKMMEQLYLELTAMNGAYFLIPGLRRKCDIARRVIESTRGDVTIEVRRSSLERTLNRLEQTIRRNEVGRVES